VKILLIGATGMIGSRIAAEALRRGHRITAATRSCRADGTSFISAEDYAVALVDELEKNEAIRRRITVAY
jgi:putative NADH-flavin reductase